MAEIFEEIIKKIITKEELIFFLEEINLLEKSIFIDVEIPLSEKLKGKVNEEFRSWLEKLEKEKFIPQSPDQQFSFFEKIKKDLLEVPQIRLEIAFQPSKEFLLRIRKWFKEEINREIILDIVVNPKITGGAIIEYQGKYLDFSLAKEITSIYG